MRLTNEIQQQQQLVQVQQQRANMQQVMFVQMLEMPLAQYEEAVRAEVDDNPALEVVDPASSAELLPGSTEADGASNDNDGSQAEHSSGNDDINDRYDDDYIPTAGQGMAKQSYTEWASDESSFYDSLRQQTAEEDLTERQQLIMDYLIGSLDSDGLLRKTLEQLSDEIAIHEYIDVTPDEIERVLTILQGFDPAGIGAQSLQQCLLIQIFRKKPTPMTKLMHTVISEYYEDFTRKRWDRLRTLLKIDEDTAEDVLREIRHLNPRPGAALGETLSRSTQQVTPDVIISIDYGTQSVSFELSNGHVPQLTTAPDFEQMIQGYRQNPSSMTRSDKEAMQYAVQKMTQAKAYIDAMRQRRETMTLVMRVIIKKQKQYILSGDDSDIRPLKMKDVAERAGVDISTVSRVCAGKYAELPWGIVTLKNFFSEAYDTGDGETVSTKEIQQALRDLIDNETPGHPLSDIRLAAELKKMGYPIARRTVAKYREKLGIPTSSLRR